MVLEGEDFSAEIPRAKLLLSYIVDEWKLDDDGNLWCPQCRDEAENHRDEAYERAAARSRNCDFADNPRHPGRDWT
jgi:hypothetical protein